MGKFDDLVSSVGVGDDGVTLAYPETFLTDLSNAFAEDMSIPVAKIDVLTAENAALQQENTLLKAHNYELLVQIPADGGGDNAPEGSEDSDDSDDSDDVTTDDLFGDSDDNEKDK